MVPVAYDVPSGSVTFSRTVARNALSSAGFTGLIVPFMDAFDFCEVPARSEGFGRTVVDNEFVVGSGWAQWANQDRNVAPDTMPVFLPTTS